ncbi:MAG TPA: type III-B CRISPR module-associated protein Cmr5 [Leptospiraceae bacterium]|nr:type III-B CRISPR module-associated protein Cmr5 [Leptospiraceae bacterium]HMX34274.1 type III-B CRISPR module-associated protein Cmr5 [Leptospiraceae bacterium]HMY32697.1 type III-B CRISPR module-associated protein Cmr5 [Leptospiraceae bacterium]HMZ64887.1 type III-B CRISPR module-associated protein Cmr5 [Leptospiraceae bacterium]HNA05384.1 type III-B CRISPR module-associated protein Cmr5 [Leptospiraceae bacterium]
MPVINKIEQGRAEYAYKCAEKGKGIGKEYKSNVKKLPMLIKTNGLGASLAFFFSKGKEETKPHGLINKQIHEWLKQNNPDLFSPQSELIKTIVDLDSVKYRFITNEVLSFLNWLKRFSDGLIKED